MKNELTVLIVVLAFCLVMNAGARADAGSCTSCGTSFNDVPSADSFHDYINAIACAGITNGCGNGNFCPVNYVTRAQMAAFIVRAKEGEPSADYCATGSAFNDVSSSDAFCPYIKRLEELNITMGCGNGNYCPDENVARDQMAAFIVRAVYGEPPADYCSSGNPFIDVDGNSVFCKYIKKLKEIGITSGCGNGNYCPSDNVTREQMAAFLFRAFLSKTCPGIPGIPKIAAGENQTVEVKSDGTLWTWGENYKDMPVQIGTDNNWASVAVGQTHSLALRSDGTLWGWGSNTYGELGTAPYDSYSPVQISHYNWIAFAAGSEYTAAVRADGTLWVSGLNDFGQLGDGTSSYYNIGTEQIGAENKWMSLAARYYHTVAVKSDGTLWAWGKNDYGQLGDGTTTDRYTPVQIGTDTNWKSVAAGYYHTAAVKSDGTLWAWGDNYYGQLGDGTYDNQRNSPVQIGTDNKWMSVATGEDHTVAVKSDGTLWAWGWNFFGQLGDGLKWNFSVNPEQIGADTNWVSVAAGKYHTVAVKSDGTLWAWGDNIYGQLGDGTTVQRNSPEQLITYIVIPSAAANGNISPNIPQAVVNNGTTSFSVAPSTGHHVASVSGCGGTLFGNTYTTGPVTGDCTVSAIFEINTYKVSASAGAGGSIAPSTDQMVNYNGTTSFSVAPDAGYHVGSVSGCGGTLSGNTYTTGPITGDCAITANFAINTFNVIPSAGSNGSFTPNTPQTVNYEGTTSFLVTPNSGYGIASVTGCGGQLSGNIYTTGPITGDCTVSANFINAYTVSTSLTAGGSVSPNTPQTVNSGSIISFTFTPDPGFAVYAAWGCGGVLVDNAYTTGPITGDCTVTATFINIYTIMPSASAGGSISPSTPVKVYSGSSMPFTVIPNEGYKISSVSGCGGTLTNNIFTTGPVTRDCTVTAIFTVE